MEKMTIHLKSAKGFEGAFREDRLKGVTERIREVLAVWGWEFKIVENDKFETESRGWQK